MDQIDINQLLLVASGGILIALLNGKAIRRLLTLPLEWIVRKTGNKTDDKLLEEVEKDLGLDGPTLEKNNDTENKR